MKPAIDFDGFLTIFLRNKSVGKSKEKSSISLIRIGRWYDGCATKGQGRSRVDAKWKWREKMERRSIGKNLTPMCFESKYHQRKAGHPLIWRMLYTHLHSSTTSTSIIWFEKNSFVRELYDVCWCRDWSACEWFGLLSFMDWFIFA